MRGSKAEAPLLQIQTKATEATKERLQRIVDRRREVVLGFTMSDLLREYIAAGLKRDEEPSPMPGPVRVRKAG